MPTTLKPAELRARAREHRHAAERDEDPMTRKARLTLAAEYERLADAIEAEANGP